MRTRRFELVPGVIVRVDEFSSGYVDLVFENNETSGLDRDDEADKPLIDAIFPPEEPAVEKAKEVV